MKSTTFLLLLTVWLMPVSLGFCQQNKTELDWSTLDRSTRIQDDLFEHVNGTWLKNTPIPADKSDYGSFGQLADLSQKRIRDLIETVAASEHESGSDAQKVGDFYQSFMDESAVESKGLKPLSAELAELKQLESKTEVWRHLGRLSQIGVGNPVGFYVSQDAKNSTAYISHISQSGTSLPDRDHFSDRRCGVDPWHDDGPCFSDAAGLSLCGGGHVEPALFPADRTYQ